MYLKDDISSFSTMNGRRTVMAIHCLDLLVLTHSRHRLLIGGLITLDWNEGGHT